MSEDGQAIVESLATWMRIVSVFFFIGAALMTLLALVSLLAGALGFILLFIYGGLALLMGYAGNWLRDAARQFSHGVAHSEEISLGQGFRALRSFLIMYGVFNILGLIKAVWDAAAG